MIYIRIKHLKPGMSIAQDVYMYRPVKMILLTKGQRLTEQYIQRLPWFGISGLYISDNRTDHIKADLPAIDDELRSESLENIQNVFGSLSASRENVKEGALDSLHNTVNQLLDSLNNKKDTLINVENLKNHDESTFNHCLSVSVLSTAIGMQLGFSRYDLFKLGFSALLHDIGKMIIPLDILNKPAHLTNAEYEVMKTHPMLGYNYVQKCGITDKDICSGIIAHHEKYDGTGYPQKLSKEEIPYFGRIIAVADVYDALTSHRPYRSPSIPAEAIEYLMGNCDIFFDYEIVKVILQKIALYPVGSQIKLSNGKYYIVVENKNNLRPVVSPLTNPKEIIDLSTDKSYRHLVIVGA